MDNVKRHMKCLLVVSMKKVLMPVIKLSPSEFNSLSAQEKIRHRKQLASHKVKTCWPPIRLRHVDIGLFIKLEHVDFGLFIAPTVQFKHVITFLITNHSSFFMDAIHPSKML